FRATTTPCVCRAAWNLPPRPRACTNDGYHEHTLSHDYSDGHPPRVWTGRLRYAVAHRGQKLRTDAGANLRRRGSCLRGSGSRSIRLLRGGGHHRRRELGLHRQRRFAEIGSQRSSWCGSERHRTRRTGGIARDREGAGSRRRLERRGSKGASDCDLDAQRYRPRARSVHRQVIAGAFLSIAVATGCKDTSWTPLGSADLILSEVKLRGAPAVSRRLDSDENFGRSVTNGIASGDSIWLEVADRIVPASASAEASLSIALSSALLRSPAKVLTLLGEKYPVEEVCGMPFLKADSAAVVSYYDSAATSLARVT